MVNHDFLRRLRLIGLIEGTSTIVLFGVAVPLKYAAEMPTAVSIVGPIHGVLFLLLVWMFFLAIGRIPIRVRLFAAGVLAALLPFGPFVVDRWLKKIGEGA